MFERASLAEYLHSQATDGLCPATRQPLRKDQVFNFPEAKRYIAAVARRRGWYEVLRE